MLKIIEKTIQKNNPTIMIADMDGTLYTSGIHIVTAPYYNLQTTAVLLKYHIPLIVVTGRSDWNFLSDCEMLLLGLPVPDVVIAAAGTVIYERNSQWKLIMNLSWRKHIALSLKGKEQNELINLSATIKTITNILKIFQINYAITTSQQFFIRITILHIPTKLLNEVIQKCTLVCDKNVKILLSEKLLFTNTSDIFSGDLIIVPRIAGKDEAIDYILSSYSQTINKPIHGLCFGDASIDIPFLAMKSKDPYYTLEQYGVHLTPLAKQVVRGNKENPFRLTLLPQPGPIAILSVLKKTYQKPELALSQNSFYRTILGLLEVPLDKIFDSTYTPNDISFYGLYKIINAIDGLSPNLKLFRKIKLLVTYIQGNLTDVFDGIRARKSNTLAPEGQLVDVFCDRAKEFYYLYHTVCCDLSSGKLEKAYLGIISSISCILPSLARASCETFGITVEEYDKYGGSMLQRTQRLLYIFFFELFESEQKIITLEKQIHNANLATYNHRIKNLPFIIDHQHLTYSRKTQLKSLERLLLLLQLFQEEYSMYDRLLQKFPHQLQDYHTDILQPYEAYLQIPISMLRRKFSFKDYQLSFHMLIPNSVFTR